MTRITPAKKRNKKRPDRTLKFRRERDLELMRFLRENYPALAALPVTVSDAAHVTPVIHIDTITLTPLPSHVNGIRSPQWEELCHYGKAHLEALALSMKGRCLSFTLNLHPEFEASLLGSKRDIRDLVGRRLRREFRDLLGVNPAYVFAVEAHGKQGEPCKVHIHGFMQAENDDLDDAIRKALLRAGGHLVSGRCKWPRALRLVQHHGEGQWENYILKNIGRRDSRLRKRRVFVSRPAVQAGQELYRLLRRGGASRPSLLRSVGPERSAKLMPVNLAARPERMTGSDMFRNVKAESTFQAGFLNVFNESYLVKLDRGAAISARERNPHII